MILSAENAERSEQQTIKSMTKAVKLMQDSQMSSLIF